jgi:flagellar motor switch protein FliG
MKSTPKGGIPAVLEMLQLLDPATRDKILANVARQDPALATKLQNQMFSFEDLTVLSPRHMQELLRVVPENTLLVALRNASEPLIAHVLANMSKRAGEILKDGLAEQAPQKLSDIQTAQAEIIEIAKELEAEGKLLLKK